MAIICPQCGRGYDVTLFAFDRQVRCECGGNVDLASGHVRRVEDSDRPSAATSMSGPESDPTGHRYGREQSTCRFTRTEPATRLKVLVPQEEEASMAEQQVGRVTHYFGKISVAAVELTDGTLSVGDTIHIKGHTSDFTQKVESMQIEGQPVQHAEAGQTVGLKVVEHARKNDAVYKVTEEES